MPARPPRASSPVENMCVSNSASRLPGRSCLSAARPLVPFRLPDRLLNRLPAARPLARPSAAARAHR
jgi:hypothetical protein